jgi:hypothetical protein
MEHMEGKKKTCNRSCRRPDDKIGYKRPTGWLLATSMKESTIVSSRTVIQSRVPTAWPITYTAGLLAFQMTITLVCKELMNQSDTQEMKGKLLPEL